MNYLSGARTWMSATLRPVAEFDTYRVGVFKKGLNRTMKHTPHRSFPVSPVHLEHMATVLDGLGKEALVVKAALLVGFFTALRQSNLLTVGRDNTTHTLLRSDITCKHNALQVKVRSSKTTKGLGQCRTYKLTRLEAQLCCPVRAWQKYYKHNKASTSPVAFTLRSGMPLTALAATRLLRVALKGSSYPEPHRFTLHALRRGAVHTCMSNGGTLEQVKELGHWTSKAVACYLPEKVVRAAPTTLKASFG